MTRAPLDVLALDIGGTKTVAAVVTATGEIVEVAERPTPRGRAVEIEDLVCEALAASHTRGCTPAVIGLSVAGLVELDRSTVALAPNLPLRAHDLGRRLRLRTGLPTVVENDVNAAGWGEFLAVGEPDSTLLVVMLGTGLGGAFVSQGRMVRGASGLAMEIGHLGFVDDGRPCGCGRRGCWEQYASGSALMAGVRTRLEAGEESCLQAVAEPSGREVQAAAEAGDALARSAFAELGTALGHGLADLMILMDPAAVVVGGGVARAAEHFLPQAVEAMSARLGPAGAFVGPTVRASTLGPTAALVGIADLARPVVSWGTLVGSAR